MDLNKTLIIGRLTADSVLEYTTGGSAIAKFSIATDHMKKKDGSTDTSFFNCKAFGKLAENLNQYLKKGKQVSIVAYLKQERWEKDGQKQSRVILNCEEIQLLGGNQQNNGNSYNNNAYGADPF
ncbi:MAG: single-stranded DNA-binding protein [Methanocorpusculum sp.]|nr:single-stranded DNA-binding protein [Methanocorpusculum sp.]MBR5450194.1 single-stranded DNA-binding protein [Methanocorpusculum sp.]